MGLEVSYIGALLAGLLSFLSPCVLPLVPPYLCYLAGTTLDEVAGDHTPNPDVAFRVFITAVLFVLGFTTVFVSLGASASLIGRVLAEYLPILAKLAGVIIILMGAHFMGLLRIGFLNREVRYHHDARPAGLLGAYVIGLAFAFGWTPCIGPVLATILAIAAVEDRVAYGATLLAVYSLGIGLPFMVAALGVGPFLRFMKRFRAWMPAVERTMGALLVVTGILFLTGALSEFSYWLIELFPGLATIG